VCASPWVRWGALRRETWSPRCAHPWTQGERALCDTSTLATLGQESYRGFLLGFLLGSEATLAMKARERRYWPTRVASLDHYSQLKSGKDPLTRTSPSESRPRHAHATPGLHYGAILASPCCGEACLVLASRARLEWNWDGETCMARTAPRSPQALWCRAVGRWRHGNVARRALLGEDSLHGGTRSTTGTRPPRHCTAPSCPVTTWSVVLG